MTKEQKRTLKKLGLKQIDLDNIFTESTPIINSEELQKHIEQSETQRITKQIDKMFGDCNCE